MSPMFVAFRNRNYRIFATGGIVSNTGTWMQRVAQDWLVLQLTHSGTAVGITTALQFLPSLLLSPYAGLVADRFPKRRLLQVTQITMAVPSLVLGTLGLVGVVEAWHVYLIAFVFGISAAFDAPARQSFTSEMVGPEELVNAVGLNAMSFNTARLIGPAIAGLMIAALGSGAKASAWVILLNAFTYLPVVYALERMDARALHSSKPVKREKGQILEGVKYVRSRPEVMLVMTVIFFGGTFGLNFQLTSALMATQVFHKGAGEYGLLGSTVAIGSFLGAMLAARRRTAGSKLVVFAGIAFGISVTIAGFMPTYVAYAVWTPITGITALTMMTGANQTVQTAVDQQFRGRVMALYMMVFMGGTPIGAPIVGWIGQTFGARWTLIAPGCIVVLGALLAVALFARKAREEAAAAPAVSGLLVADAGEVPAAS